MVVATGEVGELGITPRHAPLITRLKPGKVVVLFETARSDSSIVAGGILEVQPQVVTVLADTAIRAEDLDEAAARHAKGKPRRTVPIAPTRSRSPMPRPSCPGHHSAAGAGALRKQMRH